MNTNSKILFVYLPRYAEGICLDTMPFAFNAARLLAESGARLTVCLWERPKPAYQFLEKNPNVQLLYFEDHPWTRGARLNPLAAAQVAVRLRHRFDYIFGIGQRGLVLSNALKNIVGGRLLYFNDEYPSCWGAGRWEQAERAAAINTDVIVVPDECRIVHLLQELGLPEDHKACVLPNVPFWNPSTVNRDWHSAPVIPSQLKLILHAGSIAEWAQIPEVLFTIRSWPADTAFLIHSRVGSEKGIQEYQQSLRHLHEEGRVFWTNTRLTEEELNSLTAASKCTVALYRYRGSNTEDMGMSSGKITRSIVNGTPVLASRYRGLEFIERHELGILINTPHEIADGIKTILANHEQMRRNCLRFRESDLDFKTYWNALWKQLEPLDTTQPAALRRFPESSKRLSAD